MKLSTHHTAKTTRGSRYWRGIVEGPEGRAYVEIAQCDYGDRGEYGFVVSTGHGSRYSGVCHLKRLAILRAAHYAWHIVHPNERNPYN